MAFIAILPRLPARPRLTSPASARRQTPRAVLQLSRRALLVVLASSATGALTQAFASDSGTTPSGLQYNVVKKGNGARAVIGDLVGIRFEGRFNGKVFDNLFDSVEPYFYRVGSENILKGIDEAVQFMSVGDVVELTLPPSLAFGKKGRRASAGKPSIPPDAEVQFVLELSNIPGKDPELIEVVEE